MTRISKKAQRALIYWVGMLAVGTISFISPQYSVKFDDFSDHPTSLFRHYLSFPIFQIDLEIETDTNMPVVMVLGSGEHTMLEIDLPACGVYVRTADWYSRSLKVWFKDSSDASGEVLMRYRISFRSWHERALPQTCPPKST